MNFWLVKSEPVVFSWSRFLEEKRTGWEGVRSYAARLHLRAMKIGDLVLFYHSNEGLAIMGVAEVTREAYQDPTTTEDWSTVDLKPVFSLNNPVTLAQIKKDAGLNKMKLVQIGRLSVSPVTKAEYERVLELGK